MNLIIRDCKTSDFEPVFKLLQLLWPNQELDFDKLQQVYNKGIDSENQKLIVGLIENEIIGFCSLTIKNNLWQAGNLAHIDELIVNEHYRGNGVGKKLIDKITELAVENNCKRIELDSAFHRTSAHKFYEKMGYENRAYLFSKVLAN